MSLLDLWQSTLTAVGVVSAPFLVASLVVGVLTSLLQAATQLQENAISFVPKIAAVGVVFALMGRWVLTQLVLFSDQAMAALVQIAQEVGR